MRRRTVLAMITVVAMLPPLRGWAQRRERLWRMPRVNRGWVLAERDR